MPSSNPTTGLNTAARVVVAAPAVTLVLDGPGPQPSSRYQRQTAPVLTAQISATVQDVAGNAVSGELYYISRDTSVATVSDTGLITAVAAGQCTVEVMTAAFGNTIGIFNPDGSPLNAVYALVQCSVIEGAFTISDGLDTYLVGNSEFMHWPGWRQWDEV